MDLPNISVEEKRSISDVIYDSEIHVLRNEKESFQFYANGLFSVSSLSEAFSVAALLYLQIVIREVPGISKVYDSRIAELLIFLKATSWSDFIDDTSHDVLLWILFVTSLASSPDLMRAYFSMAQGSVDLKAELPTKDILRQRLKRVVWREKSCEDHLTRIWKEFNRLIDESMSLVL